MSRPVETLVHRETTEAPGGVSVVIVARLRWSERLRYVGYIEFDRRQVEVPYAESTTIGTCLERLRGIARRVAPRERGAA